MKIAKKTTDLYKTWGWFIIEMSHHYYRNSHCWGKMLPSYLYHTGNNTSLYWIDLCELCRWRTFSCYIRIANNILSLIWTMASTSDMPGAVWDWLNKYIQRYYRGHPWHIFHLDHPILLITYLVTWKHTHVFCISVFRSTLFHVWLAWSHDSHEGSDNPIVAIMLI